MMQWHIRPAAQDDYAFILDSWQKATRDEPWSGNVPNNMVAAVLQEALKQLLVRGARVQVACNPERHDQIIGWLCSEVGRNNEAIVHAIYTKRTFRRMGVARQLLATVGLQPTDPFPFTYKTRMSRAFVNAKHIPGIQRRHKI